MERLEHGVELRLELAVLVATLHRAGAAVFVKNRYIPAAGSNSAIE
jgi:hypothetical protein